MCKVSVFVVLLLCVTISVVKCKRFRGGGGRIHSHRTSPPAYHPPAYHPPSHGSGGGTGRPLGFDPPSNNHDNHHAPHQAAASRPLGFDPPAKPSAPIEPPKHNSPVQNAPPHGTGSGTVRPLGFDTSGHSPSGSIHPGQQIGPPKQSTPLGNSPSYNQGQNPPPYNPHYNPAGYGPPPPYTPHNNPAGYGPPPPYSPAGGYGHPPPPGGQYNPQGAYHPQGGGTTVINNNINNHHYGGYGGSYGGYSPPVYTSHDTGSTALGFFLGYSLAKVTTPSFHSNNYYDNGPRYDHYTVHHYYHNKEGVPAQATIQPNAIVACVGDSGSFCPANTTSLCTNNGAVMCVASAISTVPCSTDKQTNCIKSSVPCKDNNAPECKGSSQNTASITIPCISTAIINGSVSYVNNSIVISNSNTSITTPTNTNTNSNATVGESNRTVTTTEVNTNVTTTEANTNITTTESNTNITTTPSNISVSTTLATPTSTQIATNTADGKKEPEMFCVTVLALPAERKLSEGEKIVNHSKDIFSKFLVKALGIE